jgi:DNA-binding LytR/AlgR family response regulator
MPTALIAEDEALLRAQLRARLDEAWPELEIVAEAANGDEALVLAREHQPDIAFLDIRMPVRTGLEVARELNGACHVVFVTAYDEYAIAAFDEGAVDYLLKPPSPERMSKVVARLKARLAQAPLDLTALLARLAAREAAPAPLKRIRASLGASMQMIPVDDILYFQAQDKYTRVITPNGEALIRKPIKELYEELDPELFWQIHRATIVSHRALARVDRDARGEPIILLRGRPEKLAVSRTFSHRFKAM